MGELLQLNLPPVNLSIKITDGYRQVFDPLRRRYVVLTPEEWVRQHFTAFLINTHGYPAGLMGNEISLTLNDTRRRCDTVVFDRSGAPWMIVEYKAPHITVTRKTFDQIVRYNMVLHARYLVVSNGITHYCCEIFPTTATSQGAPYRFLPSIPPYAQ